MIISFKIKKGLTLISDKKKILYDLVFVNLVLIINCEEE